MESRRINAERFTDLGDPEIQTRISQYEMAYRMQTSVPGLMDVSKESEATFKLYGPNSRQPGNIRLELCAWRDGWPSAACALCSCSIAVGINTAICRKALKNNCDGVDQPAAGLIKDLKQRGMLDDTIVIFGGEFGRTIYSQGSLTKDNHGRDHHGRCFTTCVTGGGFRPGIDYGTTDDYSYNIVENPVHINDFNATILHNLGIDHQRFTVKYQGLDARLTGVEGAHVVKDLLAT